MNPEPLFRIQHLNIQFNGRGQLFYIPQWDIFSHDCVAVTGPNGIGKTTFLKVLSGLLNTIAGTILYKGAPILTYGNRYAREVTYVHQYPYLFKGSVYRNVLMGFQSNVFTFREKTDRIQHTLSNLGLKGYEKRYTEELSGGETYRVALARALVREPQVLLLDEPTAQADQEAKKVITEVLRQVVHRGNSTLILATHDENLCKSLDTRILRLEEFAPCRC